jgi:hypothetical protein
MSNNAINIFSTFTPPEQQKAYTFGSSLSGIMTKGGMSGKHHDVTVTDAQRKIVACWIDLMAPHAGKYNSYLSASDSSGYQAKLDKRLKWGAVEKKNIADMLAANPDNIMPNDRGSVNSIRSITGQLRIGFVPAKRALVLKKVSQGNLKVLDLKGRVIFNTKLSNQLTKGDATILLPASLGMGTYMVRFEGVNEIQQAKIFIMQ